MTFQGLCHGTFTAIRWHTLLTIGHCLPQRLKDRVSKADAHTWIEQNGSSIDLPNGSKAEVAYVYKATTGNDPAVAIVLKHPHNPSPARYINL